MLAAHHRPATPKLLHRVVALVAALALLAIVPAGASAAAPDLSAPPSQGLGAGATHACGAKTDGSVWCWGSNFFGEIGRAGDEAPTPEPVSGVSGVTEVVTGAAHTCALVQGGTVKCWGQNVVGQLGLGTSTTREFPTTVPGLTDVKALSAGVFHTCAVKFDGTVWCWGYNDAGQLGDGTKDLSETPVRVSGLGGISRISAGAEHTCALSTGGAVSCWGGGTAGKLGAPVAEALTPVTVAGLPAAWDVSAGYAHTCAVDTTGTAWCWGSADDGRLGNGSTTDTATPVAVTGINTAERISAGGSHTCATLSDGSLRCWGDGTSGQLGNGGTSSSATPVTVAGVSGAVSVSSGGVFTCAMLGSGSASCWGDGRSGQLGNGTWALTTAAKSPVDVPGFTAVGAGSGVRNGCAALTDGSLKCWGWGGDSQLGTGQPGPTAASPTTIAGVPGSVTAVAVASSHSCALTSSGGGTVYCWGINSVGQVGDGTTSGYATPSLASGLSGVTEVSTSAFSTCARTSAGKVFCWGYNDAGQLGRGNGANQTENSALPVEVTGISGAQHVAVGDNFACAIDGAAKVFCWGGNERFQLGSDSVPAGELTGAPREVNGLTNATGIAAGGSHACARLASGDVTCWGSDSSGQLGDGPTNSSGTRKTIAGLGASAVDAGGSHSCAIVSGAVRCWGNNSAGQLGNGTFTNASAPVAVTPALSGVTSLALGFAQTCAIRSGGGGTLSCWGDGYYGQIGDGPANGHFGLTGVPSAVSGLAGMILPPVKVPPIKEDPPVTEQPKQDPPKNGPPPMLPKPPPALQLKGGKLILAAWVTSPSGKACAKRVTVTISSGKTKQTASVKAKKVVIAKKTKCALTATIKLKSSKLKKAKSVKVKASGKGVKTLSATVKAS